MDLADFSGKKVALLGAGVENLSIIPHLVEAGAIITLCEQFETEVPEEIKKSITLRIGPDHLQGLGQFDVLFRAPGLPVSRVDQGLAGSQAQPIRTSTIDLMLGLKGPQVIGVTGSKGKGTTSTIFGSILEAAGKQVIVAGNIGKPIFNLWDQINPETLLVMELSSFQLEDVTHSPHIAIMLPILPNDHLEPLSVKSPNFHASLDIYAKAKANITAFQTADDYLIFAQDNQFCAEIAQKSLAKKTSVSIENSSASVLVNSEGKLQLNEGLIELKELGLKGTHNFLDAALAAAAAQILGVTIEAISQGIKNFQPLPHRLQTFATHNGITFVDDSYATAPEATMAALTAFDTPVVWIGGGSSKGASFDDLAKAVAKSSVAQVILLGQEASKIAVALQQFAPNISVDQVSSLQEAVRLAVEKAQPGGVVLLSPACASKDMFKNASERGEKFQESVNAIPL